MVDVDRTRYNALNMCFYHGHIWHGLAMNLVRSLLSLASTNSSSTL